MNAAAVYKPSPVKRYRRTKAEIEALKSALYEIVRDQQPVTVRQVFYQAVSRGLIEKSEREYKNTAGRLLVNMRREGIIPYSWITDATRWMRKPKTYDGLGQALYEMARYYRRSLWSDAPVYVEVWCEKDALAGVLYEVTDEYDVPLMVGRGFSSLSYLHRAAEDMRAEGKPVHIYYFADRDPSGLAAMRVAERELRAFAPDVELHFHLAAVTWEQVEQWNLPTRPTKRTDTRAKRYGNKPSVELDAIPPDLLRALVRECIERHIDRGVLWRLEQIEREERRGLEQFAAAWTHDEGDGDDWRKRGRPGKNSETVSPFSEDTAVKTGLASRTIQEYLQVATQIVPEVRDMIRNTALADKKQELLILARQDPADQWEIAEAVISGRVSTVQKAVRELQRKKRIENMHRNKGGHP